MNDNRRYYIGGITNIATSTSMFLWWMSMGIFLPMDISNFSAVVLHKNWIPVNIVGLFGSIIWLFSFLSLCFFKTENSKYKNLGFIGFVFGTVGIVLFTSIQYYETFILPVVCQTNPELLSFPKGYLIFGSNVVLIPLFFSGICVGVGYVFLGIDLLSRRLFKRKYVWMLMVGALVFSNGVIFPVRTIGLILFVISMIILGVRMMKENIKVRSKSTARK